MFWNFTKPVYIFIKGKANQILFKDSDKMNKDLFYSLYAGEIWTPKFVGDWILREDFLDFLKFDL